VAVVLRKLHSIGEDEGLMLSSTVGVYDCNEVAIGSCVYDWTWGWMGYRISFNSSGNCAVVGASGASSVFEYLPVCLNYSGKILLMLDDS
jgi:hypothetical protein